MARIPFRALGRPLSGKNGRFGKAHAAPQVQAEPAAEETPVEEPAADPTPAEPAAEWDPSWTKAQLLVVAQGKGLSVTSANSKAEIVAALTAAG